MSETSSCRSFVSKYCVGSGLDVGFGGDLIVPQAIGLDRPEGHPLRAKCSKPDPTHLVGDAANLFWFRDNVLDFVYSSHCLEDFEDTTSTLKEWCRVIKPNGFLVLCLPDEQTYRNATGKWHNSAHRHENFSLSYVKECLNHVPEMSVVYELWPMPTNGYSFLLVARKR